MVSIEQDNPPIIHQDLNTLKQINTNNQDQDLQHLAQNLNPQPEQFILDLNHQPANNKKIKKSKIAVTRILLVANIQAIPVTESASIPNINVQASKLVFIPDIGAQTSKSASKSLIPDRTYKFTAVPHQSIPPSTLPKFQASKQSNKIAKRKRDKSPTPAERNKTNGLKLSTPENLSINRESHFIICDNTNLIEQDDPVKSSRNYLMS